MIKTIFRTTAILITLAFSLNSFAQKGEHFKTIHHARVNFKDILAYEKANPPDLTPKKKKPNKEVFHPEFEVNESRILSEYKPKGSGTNLIKDPSPLPDADFQGLEDNNNSIPPDVNGAAGPDHLMITLNTGVKISDKEGNEISSVSLGSFWSALPGNGGSFDPKIVFDPYEERWIVVTPSSSNPASSRLFVGVTETSDPTGYWNMYSIDADPDDLHWFDYPSFGFNKNWVAVSGNMFGNGFYVVVFVIDKMAMYQGLPEVGYKRITTNEGFTLVPAFTYDDQLEELYILSNATGNQGGSGYISLFKIFGPLGLEEMTLEGYVGISDPWASWSNAPDGNLAPQLGTDDRINSGDARLQNVIYRNGKLWGTQHVFLPDDNPDHSAIQWYEMTPDGSLLQYGRVHDETGFYHFTFPTIAVNANEDIMIGFCSFSEEQYASSSYAFRYGDDPPNELREWYQFKDGLAPYVKDFGGGRNRWGDYTATMVDPYDDLDFWTLQEYADLPGGGYDRWGTWWAKIKIDAVPEASFSSNITTVPVTTGVDFTDESLYEPTDWQWIFEGGNPSTSSDQNPTGIIYDNEGVYDVTLIASNNMGSDTLIMEDHITVSAAILPEIHFSASDTIPCLADTVLLQDLSVYNPTSWQWEFSPDDITFAGGTSAESQNPQVIFDSPGKYDITLTATNPNGNSILTKAEYITPGGIKLPFEEDFEYLFLHPPLWEIENPDDDMSWEIVGVEGQNGNSKAAYVNIRNYAHFQERDRMISPLIDLSGYSTAFLEFDHAYAQRVSDYSDSLIVYIATGCMNSWERILVLGEDSLHQFATHPVTNDNFFPTADTGWCWGDYGADCYAVDLTPWTGNPGVRIMFESFNQFGNNLFVDNVRVLTYDGAGENIELSGDDMIFYPNPAKGTVTIHKTQIDGEAIIAIYNLQGQLLITRKFPGGKDISVDVSGMEPGMYLIKMEHQSRQTVGKLLIK